MNMSYSDSVITGFLLLRRRQQHLNSSAPVDRRWRPTTAPIAIESDDDEVEILPSYTAVKHTHPGITSSFTGKQ